MPVCVACSSPVPHLWRELTPGNIRLTVCAHCGAVADPYIEYEAVLLLLDVVGQSPQAYRHLLHNTEPLSFVQRLPAAVRLVALVAAQLVVLAGLAAMSAESFAQLAHF